MCSIGKGFENDEKVITYLKKLLDLKKIGNNKLIAYNYKLTIDFKITNIKEYEKLLMVEVAFITRHEFFGDTLVEFTAGVEENLEAAIKQCVNNYYNNVLSVILKALDNKYDEVFKNNFFKEEKNYKLTKGNTVTIGEREDENAFDFWTLLGEKIKQRLGNKKLYFIKVSASKIKAGDLKCECKINGLIDEEITNELKNFIEHWKAKTNFYSVKQSYVATQSGETYEEYPYTKDEVMNFCDKIIKLLGECNSEEKFYNIDNNINEITKNEFVGYEIRSFVPEIFCELVFSDITYSTQIVLVDNEEQIRMYKSQFTIYYWVYESVVRAFNERRLDELQLKTIIALSASYSSIGEALKNGRELEELHNLTFAMCGPDGYRPL